MPYIISNNLLTPADKVIKPYNCAFIAVDGPQIKGKLNMEGLEIPYDSQYTSQMVLNEEDSDIAIHYGFLGNEVTFVMIRAMYSPNDPNFEIEADQYIKYYFSDEPTKIKYMGKLMVLTGNSLKRIPQIYLTNPSTTQKVYLEIFMANQNTTTTTTTNVISGLYYNNVVSDTVVYSPTANGSSALYITDINGDTQTVIPYININTIEITDDGSHTLLIGTDSPEKIQLRFLSDFNMKQAHSRISYVMEDYTTRKLTSTEPPIDSEPPYITWTDTVGTVTGDTTSLPSGVTLTNDYLIEYYISGLTDSRDGIMSIYAADLVVYEANNLVPMSGITSQGQYTLYFTVQDIAGNDQTYTRYAMLDYTAPTISFKSVATGTTFTMNIENDTTSGTYITTGNTLIYSVDSVSDNVYSGLTITDVVVTFSGNTSYPITTIGSYTVGYSLSDYVGNTSTYTKTMNVVSNDVTPPVITFKDVATGTTFNMRISGDTISSTYITTGDTLTYAVDSVSDDVSTLSLLDVGIVISGDTCNPCSTITTSGDTYSVVYSLSDNVGNTSTYTKTMNVVSNDVTPPVITFKNVATGTTFDMSISSGTTSGTYITTGDTLTYAVDSVSDDVSTLSILDVGIVISGDTCSPCSGTTISSTGVTYSITYSLADYVGNIATYNKTMNTIT